jgi:hypothetical protein
VRRVEDGAEALHVVDSLCRRIVRQMRNPEARHKAHTLHHLARSFTPELQRDIHTRQSKKKKDAAVAAAATAAAAAALIAAYVPVAVARDAVKVHVGLWLRLLACPQFKHTIHRGMLSMNSWLSVHPWCSNPMQCPRTSQESAKRAIGIF